nr:MAG TPA: hypothetical protein [Bacteriophage sp.]
MSEWLNLNFRKNIFLEVVHTYLILNILIILQIRKKPTI